MTAKENNYLAYTNGKRINPPVLSWEDGIGTWTCSHLPAVCTPTNQQKCT